MGTFDDKVVIITGAALGMGADMAQEFADEGAGVTIADVNREAGQAKEASIKSAGNQALFVEADVSRSEECRRVVAETVAAFGGVDVLVNNVGIQGPLTETPRTPPRRCGTAFST